MVLNLNASKFRTMPIFTAPLLLGFPKCDRIAYGLSLWGAERVGFGKFAIAQNIIYRERWPI
jgi:hypothetical protein